MPLFLKLYLAHLIADFVLQFDELYKLKVKSKWGHFLHVAIHLLISLLLAYPYLQYKSVWLFIFALTGIHYLQDNIKYAIQKNPHKMFPAFVIDQIFHIAVIASVMLLPESRFHPVLNGHPGLNAVYENNALTLLAILFILSTFGGTYLLHTFRISYFQHIRPDYGISTFEMSHDIIERTFITFVMLYPPSQLWVYLCPLIGLLRLPFSKTRNWTDFILSFTYASLLGLLFKLWM
jgi:hypothetical protein